MIKKVLNGEIVMNVCFFYRIMRLLCLNWCIIIAAQAERPWSWSYKKIFSLQERTKQGDNSKLLFVKDNTPPFSQLIFSWNAFRPEQGHFTFWVQVRDALTKKWHEWHKMIAWGTAIKRSFFTTSSSGTTYHHVRLEVPSNNLADSLRIKIEPHDGASLSTLVALFVSISNFDYFKAEKSEVYNSFPSIYLSNVPLLSQMQLEHPKKDVLCSPTSCTMLINYFNTIQYNPVDIAESVYDDGLNAYGSWPFNTVHAFQCCQGNILFQVTRLGSFEELYKLLQKKIPVVVSVRGPLQGAPRDYNNGHLLIVVGWDNKTKKVICHDPAFETNEKTYVTYDIASFLTAWEKSRRLAYRAEPFIPK